MAKKSKTSPERMELARHLVKEFDLKTAADAQNLLKEFFGPMLQSMLEGEMDDHLGYDKYERTEEVKPNSRNGSSSRCRSSIHRTQLRWETFLVGPIC